jgi:short-subunit dehydrogenase
MKEDSMVPQLKPISEQVIAITGATSGIGLATARLAAGRGARVFMIARNEDELQILQDEFHGQGFETAFAVADVAEFDQLMFAADQCVRTFGTIDTWVNNAGITIYAKVLDTTEEEARRLFDTNFWGVLNGCKVALPYLNLNGGVLINVGSVLSKVAIPIQGIYSASKFAVKGLTDALRRELLEENSRVSVSLVLPSAVDTPYTQHARSHIGEPVHLPPVYAPQVVAEAILRCAERPVRELPVGAAAVVFPTFEKWFPRLQDRITAFLYRAKHQQTRVTLGDRQDGGTGNLFSLHESEGKVTGNYPGHVMRSSLLTRINSIKGVVTGGLLTGGAALIFWRRERYF